MNLYWDLVAFERDLRARQGELAAAEQLLTDTKRQVDLGALAEIEITRSLQAQVYTSQQDLLISQTNLLQQETVLKNALSRNGVLDSNLADLHTSFLSTRSRSPVRRKPGRWKHCSRELSAQRVEIAQAQINLESNRLNLVGIKNSLKPSLQAFAELTNNGLAGELTAYGASQPGVAYLAGGYGNFLAQVFRRDYPNYSAGLSLNIPLRNRAAQSDYVTSQLELRQNELNLRKSLNQVGVDVQNAVIGMQQARARYDAASKARVLQQETLEGDEKKYALGAATPYQVMLDQRDFSSAESSEVQALANYTHARIALDQALGTTLDANHIVLEEALAGHVSRPSSLPASLPSEDGK